MSGHSKWAQIKRAKGTADAKRGQVFTRLGREIMVAVRAGGGDPEGNARLRLAIQRARDQNMPMENIERAIKRAQGAAEASALQEITYEGYGPGGIAILMAAVTDNRNRTSAEVKHAFSRGANLAEAGSVSWLFDSKGVIAVEGGDKAEDIALQAIDAGAEDVKVEDGALEIYTRPQDLEIVRRALEARKVAVTSAEISWVPRSMIELDEKNAGPALKFLERLEELEDVQHVYTNADFPADVLEKIQTEVA